MVEPSTFPPFRIDPGEVCRVFIASCCGFAGLVSRSKHPLPVLGTGRVKFEVLGVEFPSVRPDVGEQEIKFIFALIPERFLDRLEAYWRFQNARGSAHAVTVILEASSTAQCAPIAR